MIEIIPAIDLKDGRCVRLLQGDFAKETVYSGDPVEVAIRFADSGIKRLHMVDLDGARTGRPAHLNVLRRVTAAASSNVDYGGGVRSVEDVRMIFDAGASLVTIGSLAIRSPELVGEWLTGFGDRFLIGIDIRNGNAATDGWTETTNVPIEVAIEKLVGFGAKTFFVTDISKDGAMSGPAVDLYKDLITAFPGVAFIASGGVRNTDDIRAVADAGCTGVILGRALYEGAITLEEISEYAR